MAVINSTLVEMVDCKNVMKIMVVATNPHVGAQTNSRQVVWGRS